MNEHDRSTELPGDIASLWIDTAPGDPFPPLRGDLSVDVAVLGAGIAGITAAVLLKRAGKRVAVIEAGRVLRGVTGYTTAKVTSNHNLIYADLVQKFGEEGARIYAESNQAAIERIARFVEEEGIDCDFERKSNYTYTESENDLRSIKEEVRVAERLGLPAHFVYNTRLPFPIAGGIRFDNQAQFHPRKYLLHLAGAVPGEGSHVFEQTRAFDVEEGRPCRVITDRGVVSAEDVIVATHYPILDRGAFFAKVHPKREYVVCARIDPAQDPEGMFITAGFPTRSIRTAPHAGGLLLIVGGEKHRPGEEPETEERYRILEEYTRSRFGVESFEYRWSTQDNYPVDRVPYIGKLRRGFDHLWVATGFGAWGMTNGTLSGMLLSDLILGTENPWAELYDANRVKPAASARKFIQENANVARHWFGDRLAEPDAESLRELAPGEGALVEIDGEKIAAYRDDQGTLHALSPVCTHMGCIVQWNRAERSWDCPCHGSRFSAEGSVIHGPAVEDLERKEL